MRRIFFATIILLSTFALYAQEEAISDKKSEVVYKHEVKLSSGGSLHDLDNAPASLFYGSCSFAYFYRPIKWFWFGINAVGSVGGIEKYTWREYYPDNTFKDFFIAKRNFGFALAPELKFSYLNRKKIILYSAISVGYCWDAVAYVKNHVYFQVTCIGLSYYFGKNNKGFVGLEYGGGYKGVFNIHGGYRF